MLGRALVRKLGADAAVAGKRDDVARSARDFAPGGLDAARDPMTTSPLGV